MVRATLARTAIVIGLLALSGCTLYVPRGPVADFFLKDYELADYQPDEADFAREVRRVEPSPGSSALGGLVGALAGGRRGAQTPAASPGFGGLGGAVLANLYDRAQRTEPLPEDYELFSLALPIVATDPNKGPTVGLLPVGVFKEQSRITNILAPDVTYNEIDGAGAIFRMRRAFSRDSDLLVDAGTSTEGNDDYEIRYRQRRVGPNRAIYYMADFAYRTQLAQRFYGVGNETEDDAESTYVFRRTTGEALLGFELPLDFNIELSERIVSYKVGPGRLEDIPSTRAVFPNVAGVRDGRISILAHRIALIYDSRDSIAAPTEGIYGEFTYELSDGSLGSDIDFQRFGLRLTVLIPKFKKRFISAVNFAGWIMTGDGIPFFELTQLGGKNTIRGYGQGRFVDQNGYVVNFEERWNVIRYNVAGVDQVIQLAGFIDVGRVFAEGERFKFKDTKIAAGAAVRLVVPDSELVASIDMGFSDEGSAVFVGLDYPF